MLLVSKHESVEWARTPITFTFNFFIVRENYMMHNERHDAEKLGSRPICDGIAKLLKTRPSLKRRHTVDERAEISEPFRKD